MGRVIPPLIALALWVPGARSFHQLYMGGKTKHKRRKVRGHLDTETLLKINVFTIISQNTATTNTPVKLTHPPTNIPSASPSFPPPTDSFLNPPQIREPRRISKAHW